MSRRPKAPRRFLLRKVLEGLLVVLGCVASGSLECGGVELSPTQRQGARLYGRMCAVCHGRDGEGYKADRAPALAHPGFLATVNDAFIAHAITHGRAGTTMSAWGLERGGPLSRSDVNAVVSFVRSWERWPRASLDERPVAGVASRGAAVFGRECVRCHGPLGTGGPEVHIGDADFLSTAGNGFLRYAIGEGRPGTPMPSFAASLGSDGIEDVLALMRSWQSSAPSLPRAAPARPPPIPLGPVPLNPRGPEPVGFRAAPATTPVDVVKAELDRGAKMALLDARAPSDYASEHIAGAVSVPFYDVDAYVSALPRDAWLVAYCACPHAESGQLAQKLTSKGFTKVTILDEGLGLWRAKMYGTRTGWDP